ncbi:MAG: PAN domain-containing protein [Rhizobiaceae bacterium]
MKRLVSCLMLLASAGWLAPAFAQEEVARFDLFAPSANRISPDERVAGLNPERMDVIGYFALTPEAARSLGESSPIPREIRIALPDDGAVTCAFPAQPDGEAESGQVTLRGTVENAEPGEHCAMVINDGAVVGQIQLLSGLYKIVPLGNGEHVVARVRPGAYPEGAEPRLKSEGEQQGPRPGEDREAPQLRAAGEMCDMPNPVGGLPRVFGPIRVMILYTSQARWSASDIDASIQLMMSQLREALSADSTGGRFSVMVELAHAQEIDYDQDTSASMGEDLERLADPRDPAFAFLGALRQKHRADLVHLLVGPRSGDPCGIGYTLRDVTPWNVGIGFSASEVSCATDAGAFTHEIGHNLGMYHDGYVERDREPDQFNFGVALPELGYRSIMAYNDACADRGIDCMRLPLFSTPRITVRGEPFGRHPAKGDGAYNVEVLCRAAASVAAFRLSPGPYAVYENNALEGKELARKKDVTQNQCAAMCKDNKQCIGYDYDKWNRWCFLKTGITGLRLEPKSVSGTLHMFGEPARLDEPVIMDRYRGKHFPGKAYSVSREGSFESCEATCEGDAHCIGFTYYRDRNRCESFASVGEYFSKAGADSGVKRQGSQR